MNQNQTVEKLHTMRLFGMKNAFQTVLESSQSYTNDQLLSYLVEAEWEDRQSRKVTRYLKAARFRYQASLEEVDFLTARNLDKNLFLRLADGTFIQNISPSLLQDPQAVEKALSLRL